MSIDRIDGEFYYAELRESSIIGNDPVWLFFRNDDDSNVIDQATRPEVARAIIDQLDKQARHFITLDAATPEPSAPAERNCALCKQLFLLPDICDRCVEENPGWGIEHFTDEAPEKADVSDEQIQIAKDAMHPESGDVQLTQREPFSAPSSRLARELLDFASTGWGFATSKQREACAYDRRFDAFADRVVALDSEAPGDGWQAIDSAPKGSMVNVYEQGTGRVACAYLAAGNWIQAGPNGAAGLWFTPTHWAEIPKPPAANPDPGGES